MLYLFLLFVYTYISFILEIKKKLEANFDLDVGNYKDAWVLVKIEQN